MYLRNDDKHVGYSLQINNLLESLMAHTHTLTTLGH